MTGAGPHAAGPIVGAVYLLAENDYRFGLGALLVRVTRVMAPVEFGEGGRTELWWHVEAVCCVPHHTGPGQQRSLYLRAAGLPTARRSP